MDTTLIQSYFSKCTLTVVAFISFFFFFLLFKRKNKVGSVRDAFHDSCHFQATNQIRSAPWIYLLNEYILRGVDSKKNPGEHPPGSGLIRYIELESIFFIVSETTLQYAILKFMKTNSQLDTITDQCI